MKAGQAKGRVKMNLLRETIEELKENKKKEKDVLWVGSKDNYITWNEFKKIADIEYDNGYGGQEIAMDLLIVGKDFWLERQEYDGSEWWEFKETPCKPKAKGNIKKVVGSSWENLKEINF